MDRLTLRRAADTTSRSVTTLRRYIRSGRLSAEKLPGRFGPEYFVTMDSLTAAGLTIALEKPAPEARRETALAPVRASAQALAAPPPRPFAEAVPLGLYQELQMKHEQLLVQYRMVRAGGLRLLELQAEIEARRRQLEEAQAETARVKERLAREAGELRKRLREAELEAEGRRVETAALREKVRGLEMLTRNSVTTETIDRQFDEVMAQMRRVERLTVERQAGEPQPVAWTERAPQPDPEH